MIAIVNYGVGNLFSIKNMLKKIGADANITASVDEINKADKIILPGIGAFDHCMTMFNNSGFRDVVSEKAFDKKTPVLGICVGMQMLVEGSEEGVMPGLGWIKGKTMRFKKELLGDLKVPHMGWTDVIIKKSSPLVKDFEGSRFYFVHSYYVQPQDASDELLSANYGYDFTAAIQRDNIFGVQFHPEKSHRFGMKLLKNFASDC